MVLENFDLEKFVVRENALEKVSYNRLNLKIFSPQNLFDS